MREGEAIQKGLEDGFPDNPPQSVTGYLAIWSDGSKRFLPTREKALRATHFVENGGAHFPNTVIDLSEHGIQYRQGEGLD